MIKINEALARANAAGLKIKKGDIAARLWPDSLPITRAVNMSALISGRTERVSPEWVKIICEMTGVSSDFLLGLTEE